MTTGPSKRAGTEPGGAARRVSSVEVHRVAYVVVGSHTPVWVTIHIPADSAAGVYEGSILARSGGRLVARRPFRLRVVSAAEPEEMSFKVTNWFSLDDKTSRPATC